MAKLMIPRQFALRFGKEEMRIFLFLLLIFIPDSLKYVSGLTADLDYYLSFLRSFISLWYILLYLLGRVNRRYSFNTIILCYSCMLFYITAIGMNSSGVISLINNFVRNYVPIIGVLAFTVYWSERNLKQLLRVATFFFCVICVINSISMLLYGTIVYDEVYKDIFFLGPKNGLTMYYYIGAIFVGLNFIIQEKPFGLEEILYFLSFAISSIVGKSGMEILVFLITMVGILLNRTRFIRNISQRFVLYLLIPIFYSVISFLLLIRENQIFNDISSRFMRKERSLEIRQIIWHDAFFQIKESRYLGKGPFAIASNWGGVEWYGHNGVVDITLRGGVICLILIGVIIILVSHDLYKLRKNSATALLVFAFVALLILSFVEGPFLNSRYAFFFAIVCGLTQYISKGKKIEIVRHEQ